jgi:hypothetical protein
VPAREDKKIIVKRSHLSNQDLSVKYNAIATKSRHVLVLPAKPPHFPLLSETSTVISWKVARRCIA